MHGLRLNKVFFALCGLVVIQTSVCRQDDKQVHEAMITITRNGKPTHYVGHYGTTSRLEDVSMHKLTFCWVEMDVGSFISSYEANLDHEEISLLISFNWIVNSTSVFGRKQLSTRKKTFQLFVVSCQVSIRR